MLLFVILACIGIVSGDTPANCTYEDVVGTWTFYESQRTGTKDLDCTTKLGLTHKTSVTLAYPNSVVDQFGNTGTWTMVYNQGFEVNVNGRSYFAFSDFSVVSKKEVVSHCGRTKKGQGWSHDVTVRNWACFVGKKVEKFGQANTKVHALPPQTLNRGMAEYTQQHWQAELINEKQSSWMATTYPHLQGRKLEEIEKMKGGHRSRIFHRPSKPKSSLLTSKFEAGEVLPDSFDWRNVSGVNYVPQVRDQGSCGSCYAFSSMGMLEARLRIRTGHTRNYTLSPQDVVSCSPLSQGCEGGFPYLTAGRYGKDYGVVEEECNKYKGNDGQCGTKSNCHRYYVSSYSYVGGYYGACSELEMKRALVRNGPLSVSFEVYPDFMMYKSGVYHRTKLLQRSVKFAPFQITNHAVLLVGYGHDPTVKEDYWIVQNSWGEQWGENGFFRIRRGTDECAIESIAVEAFPIP